MLKVLFVAAEAVPFIKTGGLADVAGSLPKALTAQGVDIRVVMPKYENIPAEYQQKMKHIGETTVNLSWRSQYCGVSKLTQDSVPFYFIDNEYYFKRSGLYGYDDDAERFAFFSKAVFEILPLIDFVPDIIHCNDWHAGMVSVFLKDQYHFKYPKLRTVYTIHNLRYQGVFGKDIMGDILGLDWKHFHEGGVEFDGAVNYMKSGIVYSDFITTVSQSYAEEIKCPFYGEQLDALLREKSHCLAGIINGIDYDVYDPRKDEKIYHKYSTENIYDKVENKVKLQEKLGLPQNRSIPMIGLVARLVAPKGLDLIAHVIEELISGENVQIVILGTGESQYEELFRNMAWKYPRKVSANIMFDNELAQQIYAAADMFLMPSQYEPCGIGQLIALKYGTIPIVRETGGLKDSVRAYNKYDGTGNGFSFANYNAHELLFAIKKALGAYDDKSVWQGIIKNAMKSDFSWQRSAKQYLKLYENLQQK